MASNTSDLLPVVAGGNSTTHAIITDEFGVERACATWPGLTIIETAGGLEEVIGCLTDTIAGLGRRETAPLRPSAAGELGGGTRLAQSDESTFAEMSTCVDVESA